MRKTILIIGLIFTTITGYCQNNLVGSKAPDIEIEDWIYPKIKVSDWEIRKVPENLEGKTIILDFWFTNCAPCVASIPELNKLRKKFQEIVFLSISFEQKNKIENFMDKMVMYYPVGSDPEKKTIDSFEVSGYPQTYVIDKKGIIQWHGSPFKLNEKVLKEVLERPNRIKNISVNDSEIPTETSAYSFTIEKHNLNMDKSTYFHYNPYDINVFNKDLYNILKTFYGINRSRVLTDDTSLLKTSFDLTLKADKEITTEANCVEMLKCLLPEHLGLKLEKVKKDTLVNNIQIKNDSLLNSHLSKSKFLGTSKRNDNWIAKGARFEDLKNILENEYNMLVVFDQRNNQKYDFRIPINDYSKLRKVLKQEYGLLIKPNKHVTDFWIIDNLEEK